MLQTKDMLFQARLELNEHISMMVTKIRTRHPKSCVPRELFASLMQQTWLTRLTFYILQLQSILISSGLS